ncbi:hypothetical protein THRCLA_05365 [Thraustotheca clavata]|uniref:Protein phosphatase n=1 Tax=Thraustotheca clavata TaxID=74557 RepID=A0A0A7CLF3_9STRA|nr:secreted protein [Thraustotheca clavata]OQS02244.1 hypothetical protein THRCLA_05365 [Thraustotheca clavata]
MRLFVSVAACVALVWGEESQETCSFNAQGQYSCRKENFGVEIGVACKPKKSRQVSKAPNANAAKNCGEEAYYIASTDKYLSFGIAELSFGIVDGVAGWTESRDDTSAFSLALVRGSKDAFEKSTLRKPKPLDLMMKGYEAVLNGGGANLGISNAVFLVIDKETGKLDAVNLGHAGYAITRNRNGIGLQEEKSSTLDDICKFSTYLSWMHSRNVNKYPPVRSFPTSSVLKVGNFVQAGDVVIIGSDGFFDNVFGDEILDETRCFLYPVYKNHATYFEQRSEYDDDPLPILSKTAQKFQQPMFDLSHSLTLMADSYGHDHGHEPPPCKEACAHQCVGRVDDTTAITIYIHGKIV